MSFPASDDEPPPHLRSFQEMQILIDVFRLAKSNRRFDGALHHLADRDRSWHHIDLAMFELNNTLEEGSVIRAGYTTQETWNRFWHSVCRNHLCPVTTPTADEPPWMTLTQAYEFGAEILRLALEHNRIGEGMSRFA